MTEKCRAAVTRQPFRMRGTTPLSAWNIRGQRVFARPPTGQQVKWSGSLVEQGLEDLKGLLSRRGLLPNPGFRQVDDRPVCPVHCPGQGCDAVAGRQGVGVAWAQDPLYVRQQLPEQPQRPGRLPA